MRILCTRCSTRRRDHLQSGLARRACGHVAPYSGFGRAHDALPMKELESQFCGFCRQCDLRETSGFAVGNPTLQPSGVKCIQC